MSITPKASTIRQLRLARGWSQEELASQARIGERTVQRAELGLPARPSTLVTLASALGVDLREITLNLALEVDVTERPENARPQPLGVYGPLLAALCDANNAVFHWRRHFSNTFEYRGFFMRAQSPPVFTPLEAAEPIAATISLALHKDVSEAVKALKRMHREILEVGAVLRNSSSTGYRLSPAADDEIKKMGSHTCDYAEFHLRRAIDELAAAMSLETSTLPLLRL